MNGSQTAAAAVHLAAVARQGAAAVAVSCRRHDAGRSDEARRDAAGDRDRHQPAGAHALGRIEVGKQRPAARRAGADGGSGRASDIYAAISGHRAIAEARRQSAAAQHGEPRRQRAATHALHLFPRHRPTPSLQQTQAGLRLRRHRRLQPQARGARRERSLYRDLCRRFRPGADRARRRRSMSLARAEPAPFRSRAASQARRYPGPGDTLRPAK